MIKIALVLPYFGKLPNTFDFFLQSCRCNKTIDFIIVTDLLEGISLGENIKIVRMSFAQLKERVQNLFDFPISLNAPYKLCDYKPIYGHIFQKELSEYDFWGYCDCDLIFGDLRKFITEEILYRYDRIFDRGHLSLYRNNTKMINLYKENPIYEKVVQSDEIFIFDESFSSGINKTCVEFGIEFYKEREFIFDCAVPKFDFLNVNNKEVVTLFHFVNGALFSKNLQTNEEKELMYVHFQKRKFEITKDCNENDFYIIPNIYCTENQLDGLLKKKKKQPFYCLKYYKNRIKNAVSKRYIRFLIKIKKTEKV